MKFKNSDEISKEIDIDILPVILIFKNVIINDIKLKPLKRYCACAYLEIDLNNAYMLIMI